jgi:hypothetical protein
MLSEGSQASSVRPSDKDSVKVKILIFWISVEFHNLER